MKMIGQSDGHRIEVGLLQQFVEVSVTARNVVARGSFARTLWIYLRHGDDGRSMTGRKTMEMINSNTPGPDHRTTQLVGHSTMEVMSSLHPLNTSFL